MGDIRVGKPDTKPDISAHTPGVSQGNAPGGTSADDGFEETGEVGAGRPSMKSTARIEKGCVELVKPGNPGANTPADRPSGDRA